ncbi:MAG: cytochrome P460 family protein, partial [Acidobacteriota bacterium]
MMFERRPKFPQGSIIIKEKLAASNDVSPELLTIMIKRNKGFNPENGDWEYLVVNGEGTTIQARGKLANCQTCHQGQQDSDYIFRNYLSPEASKFLK